MKTPKMKGPSQEELEATRLQNEQLQKRNAQLDAEEAQRRADTERQMRALANNRVGIRSLLSGDWSGFQRGGDLGAR